MLVSRLDDYARKLGQRISNATAETADDIAKAARPGAESVRVGAALHVEQEGPYQFNVVAGTHNVFWAHFQERGSIHRAPKPFLIPAMERERANLSAFKRALTKQA